MVKRIAVYGDYETSKVVVAKQPVWIRRMDGVVQRYWKKTRVKVVVQESGRYEFYGSGKDLYRAVALAHRYMPRGYVTVDAVDFVDDPGAYGVPGEWVWVEKDS